MEGFTVSQVERLTGVNRKTLHFWDRTGFLSPSVQAAHGTGSRRQYSFRDLVALRVAVQLRAAGISLQSLRIVMDRLRTRSDLESPLAESYLVTDGTEVWERRGEDLMAVLRRPGQGFFTFVIDVPKTVRAVRQDLELEGLG